MAITAWTLSIGVLSVALVVAPRPPPPPAEQASATAVAIPKAAATPATITPPAKGVDEDNAPFDSTDCKACHEPAVTKLQQTRHGGLEQSCASCHDRAKSLAHSKGQADGLGTPGPSIKTMAARDVSATCLGCHEKGDRMHFAGSAHDRKDVSCISCHSVHSFKSVRSQLKTVKDSENCFSCHTQIRAKMMRSSHHPVREGKLDCSSCHNPHDGSKPKLLKTSWVNDTCYSCHAEKRGPFLWEHAPVRENCANCHDPHGSNHDKLLVAKLPFLCQRCHLNTRHPGTLYDGATSLAGASVPSAGVPTVSNRAVEHACKNCHQNVHGSNSPSGAYLGR
ncbi:MAG: DmsE family decaheme c-type cytochrome [Vicinamibacteria bacterium]